MRYENGDALETVGESNKTCFEMKIFLKVRVELKAVSTAVIATTVSAAECDIVTCMITL